MDKEEVLEIMVTVTTVGNSGDAKKISKNIVEKHLAACAQIDEISSIYPWKDNVEEETEFRIFFKHTKEITGKLKKSLQDLHPYETPEVISWKVSVTESYYNWCKKNCKLVN